MNITIIASGNLNKSIVDDNNSGKLIVAVTFDGVMFLSMISTFVALIYHSRHLIKRHRPSYAFVEAASEMRPLYHYKSNLCRKAKAMTPIQW